MPSSEVNLRWMQEIARYYNVKSQFVLWGNIHDLYPVNINGTIAPLPLDASIREILKNEHYDLVMKYEPLFGFSILHGTEDDFRKVTNVELSSSEQKQASLTKVAEMLERVYAQQDLSVAVILAFGSRLNDSCFQQANSEFFYRTYRLGINSKQFMPKNSPEIKIARHQLLFWLMDKGNDLPPWYALDNPRIHTLSLPRPDHAVRRYVIDACCRAIAGYAETPEEQKEEKKALFLDQTGGMFASEIIAISQIAKKENLPFSQVGEAIRRYKLGIVENPWAKISHSTFANAQETLESRVIGQPWAVRHSVDVLKRSLFNLSGAQFSKMPQKPKGVLFLAGPTGVGKTELAKSITEMIFGTPTSYLRFDMSEFSHEHADQRLVGSPPGYVGYDVGGQLTNAVREKPFSLILFDEIEKGHPKILDIFLQILDDGRLTSGRGETVYFSETLIVFTSNLGMFETDSLGKRQQMVSPDLDYARVQEKILAAIENYFKNQINRPEILNRIGNNIIVFDFIRQDVADKIFSKMLNNVLWKLWDDHKIKLEFASSVKEELCRSCCADLSMGGRGIGNALEKYFINPLSRALFACDASAGAYIADSILIDDHGAEIKLERKNT